MPSHPSNSPHKRLRAYELAQDFACRVRLHTLSLPPGHADLRDQANRSSHAVVRNVAEGANRWTPADKIARFNIAQGELGECEACLETLRRLDFIAADVHDALEALANELGAVLAGLIRAQQRRAGGE